MLLPVSPLMRVERIATSDAAGGTMTLSGLLYRPDRVGDPPRVSIASAAPEPGAAAGGIAIDVVAGFGASPEDVPAPLRQAIRLLVARWFENRGDGSRSDAPLPPDIAALVTPYRRARL